LVGDVEWAVKGDPDVEAGESVDSAELLYNSEVVGGGGNLMVDGGV